MSAGTFAEMIAEVEAMDDDAVLQRLREVEGRRRELEAEQAVLLARLDEAKVYRRDGHATMWGLLRSSLGWSDRECRTRMQIARLVAAYSDAGESLFEAWAPVANIAAIAAGFANPRCGREIDAVIGTLFTEAGRMEYDDFRQLVARWQLLADVDGAHRDRERSHARRHAELTIFDGKGTLVAEWGDLDSAANREIFERFVEAEFHADWDATVAAHGQRACTALLPRTDAQRRADALTTIFERAASAPPGSRAPKPVAHIHLDYHTWSDLMIEAGLFPQRFTDPFETGGVLVSQRRCETGDGELIDPYTALQATLEGYVRFVIHDDHGLPIHWGRQRRLFHGPAREAVMSLSPRCTHPGCRVRAGRSQADHNQPWCNGGETRPDNGGPRCKRHNNFRNHGYTVHRDRHGHWHTYRPDGGEI